MKKSHLVLLFLVLTAGVVAYQLIDPESETQPTEVDLSASPQEIAYDALRQTQTWDYTFTKTWELANENESKTVSISRTKVEHSGDQYYIEYSTDQSVTDTKARYGNKIRDWVKFDSWTRRSTLNPYTEEYSPFEQLNHVKNQSVVVVNKTDSLLVLRIKNRTTADRVTRYPQLQKNPEAQLTLYIDKETGHLRKVVVTSVLSNIADKKTVIYRFSDFDDTDVTRPEGIDYTVDEFLRDLFDNPKNTK